MILNNKYDTYDTTMKTQKLMFNIFAFNSFIWKIMHLMPHEAGQDMIDGSLFLCAHRVLAQNDLKLASSRVAKYFNFIFHNLILIR